MVSSPQRTAESFTDFFTESEAVLRHALVATCGPEVGREAASDALEYAWSHWDRIEPMDYPVAYLFRVGRSCAKKYRRRAIAPDIPEPSTVPWVEPQLESALRHLSGRQRLAVVLRNSFGYTYDEIADVMGVSITTVQKHNERALAKLRRRLVVS